MASTRARFATSRMTVAGEPSDPIDSRSAPATASIADELSRQYYLGYPAPGKQDGRWHTIRVETREKSLRVRARRGYIATP